MRRIPFEIWLVVLVLASHLYVALLPANSLVNWYHSDDAFYYFKVAQNFTEGRGISFDGIGRSSGFHPLWMLLLTPIFALTRGDLILPLRLVVMLSAAFSAGTAVLLYRLSRRALGVHAAALVAFLWAFHPLVHGNITEMGLESPLSAFMVALLLYRLVQEGQAQQPSYGRWFITGLVAALTVLARLDNVFIVLIAGLWLVFPPRRLRYLLVSDVVLLAGGVLVMSFLRVGLGPPAIPYLMSTQVMVLVVLAVRVPIYYLLGLYAGPVGRSGLGAHLLRAALASLLSTGAITTLMLAMQALTVFPGFPRVLLAYEAVYALAAVLLTRAAAVLLSARGSEPDPPLRWGSVLTRAGFFFMPVGLILIAYMGASFAYFGTFMPVSGQIKRWWGTLYTIYGQPVTSVPQMLGLFNLGPWDLVLRVLRYPVGLAAPLRLALWGIPAALLLLRPGYRAHLAQGLHRMALYPLFAGGFLQMIVYTGTSYTHVRPWYWVAQFMLLTLVFGLLADSLLRWLQSLPRMRNRAGFLSPATVLAAALCALIFTVGAADVIRRMPASVPPEQRDAYLEETRLLEAATQPGDRIGFTGGGTTAYFIKDRTIVNLDGLMNTYEYFQTLKQWQGAGYLDRIGLQYIVARDFVITKSEPYTQFEGRLEEIEHFGDNTFYRWKPAAE